LGPATRADCEAIQIRRRNGKPIALPLPADLDMDEEAEFEPTDTQKVILISLRQCGEMKTDALVDKSGLSKSQLFEKGRGIAQLTEAGLMSHRPRTGYFLTEEGERVAALLD
jgi:hypothetical protein